MTNADNGTDIDAVDHRRRFVMPAVVLGLLGGHMLFIIIAITLATGDRSFAVVPDYYEKAVDYDEHKAMLMHSAALGWSVQLQAGAMQDANGQRDVIVELRDREGLPLRGLDVRVSGYHLARAGEPMTVVCVEALPGQYVGQARVTKEGFWQFEVSAAGGAEPFVADLRQFVPAAGGTR